MPYTLTKHTTIDEMRDSRVVMTKDEALAADTGNGIVIDFHDEGHPDARYYIYFDDFVLAEPVPGHFEALIHDYQHAGSLAEMEEKLFAWLQFEVFPD